MADVVGDLVYEAAIDSGKFDAGLAKLENNAKKAANNVDKAAQKVATLRQQLEELQGKYTKETDEYKAQLADRDYLDAITKTISDKGIKFSSKAAERAYIADLKAKHLELKDGALDGFDEWHKTQTEADPSAFQTGKPAPTFVKPVGTGGAPASEGKGAMYAKQFNAQYAQIAKKE